MTMDLDREELHLISYPRAHFVVFRPRTGEILDLGRISQTDALGPSWSADGHTYTTDDDGFILRYDPDSERIVQLPIRIPDAPWRNSAGNFTRRMKVGPDGVKLYGFGAQSTRLFEYDPTVPPYGQITDFGLVCGHEGQSEPNFLLPPKALTFGLDGLIYCGMGNSEISIDDDGGPHIIAFDPATRRSTDLGLIQAPGFPQVTTCQDMVTGTDGTIYVAPTVDKQPLQLVLFHPEGRLPEARGDGARGPVVIRPIGQCGDSGPILQRWGDVRLDHLQMERAFATEGTMVARRLGWDSKMPLIPPGETSITGLALGANHKLYGVTSGQRSHLFVFNPAGDTFGPWAAPIDLGVVAGGGVSCGALVWAGDGNLYLGTCPDQGAGHLYRHSPACEVPIHLDEWTIPQALYGPDQIEDLGVPLPGEGIYTLVSLSPTLISGITSPGGSFFVYDVHDQRLVYRQELAARFPSRALAVMPDGTVCGSASDGRLFRYHPDQGRVERLPWRLPAGKGRDYLNAIDSLATTPDGTIYGGTRADGMLFRLEPQTGRPTGLGKPAPGARIRALVAAPGGQVYGVAGEEGRLGHLFRYDPRSGEMVDVGIPRATWPEEWTGHEFGAAAVGAHGEIYLGEVGRVARLFTFFPPY